MLFAWVKDLKLMAGEVLSGVEVDEWEWSESGFLFFTYSYYYT
jgi:hypothetical protein